MRGERGRHRAGAAPVAGDTGYGAGGGSASTQLLPMHWAAQVLRIGIRYIEYSLYLMHLGRLHIVILKFRRHCSIILIAGSGDDDSTVRYKSVSKCAVEFF